MPKLKVYRKGESVIIDNEFIGDKVVIQQEDWDLRIYGDDIYFIYQHPSERHQVQQKLSLSELVDEDGDQYEDELDKLADKLADRLT